MHITTYSPILFLSACLLAGRSTILYSDNCLVADALRAYNEPLALEFLSRGETASSESLNVAISINNIDMVKKLFELGVQPTEESLNIAVYINNDEIVAELLKHNTPISRDAFGSAVYSNNIRIVEMLVAHGAPVEWSFLVQALKSRNMLLYKALTSGPQIDSNVINEALLNVLRLPFINIVDIEEALQALDSEQRKAIADKIVPHLERTFKLQAYSMKKSLTQNLNLDTK